ncbi:MAG: sulfatase-like hydrolase/transferase [Candidatus Omnitrophota bacterium]
MPNPLSRRDFLTAASALSAGALWSGDASAMDFHHAKPNILWLTSEDNGPHLGCYGDRYADSPHIDALAAKGVIYLNAWSNAPVCAPARTTIISGVYPPCTGSEHMRSMVELPSFMKMFPAYLREAGYYCTNNVKEDYNLEKTGQVWDESSSKAHWRNRKPGQPFFAVFNFTTTHESQIRKRPHAAVHDPAKVRVPAYHPDAPEARQDWAQYYDKITEMDAQAGKALQELEQDGLAEDAIVFYYGDHGPGMPRCKRWPYNSGLRVPLVVYIPPKYKSLMPDNCAAGGRSSRLVGFVDLAPTVLSLAGVKPPDFMQGHAFLGQYVAPEPDYAYGFRGRMDERYDMVRSVRNRRYIYIRNYMPHKIYGQYLAYMFQTPTTQAWKKLYDEGKLHPPQTYFWEPKPPEELYDLQNDPDEVKNLADSAEHYDMLIQLRQELRRFELDIRDIGFLPEDEIHVRSKETTPYEMGHDDAKYPLEKILTMAEMASFMKTEAIPDLMRKFQDGDGAVRYWAAMGILMRGAAAVTAAKYSLHTALADSSPSVRIVAAQALGQYGGAEDIALALAVLIELASLDKNSVYVSIAALNAIDDLGEKAMSLKELIAALPRENASIVPRMKEYVPRMIERILSR